MPWTIVGAVALPRSDLCRKNVSFLGCYQSIGIRQRKTPSLDAAHQRDGKSEMTGAVGVRAIHLPKMITQFLLLFHHGNLARIALCPSLHPIRLELLIGGKTRSVSTCAPCQCKAQ